MVIALNETSIFILGQNGRLDNMKITESEELIINLLWEKGSLSVMQIVQELEKEKNWSKQSIISFLKRMEQKGTVTYIMQGRTKFYSAIAKKEDIVRKETKGILNRFFDGKLGSMVSYMAKETKITGEDIQELKQLLEKLEEENRD